MSASTAKTAHSRRDGFLLVLLAALFFASFNPLLLVSTRSKGTLVDFKTAYLSARCLFDHRDPYNAQTLLAKFLQMDGTLPQNSYGKYVREGATKYFYPPSVFAVTVPFALLPFSVAQMIWLCATITTYILAVFLVWSFAVDYAPTLASVLLALCLAGSSTHVLWGNAAGLSVALCVLSVWCFLRNRFVPAGILCMAISLALKPTDSGLVWLFFLLAGKPYRAYALRSLALVAAGSLPVLFYLQRIAPHWIDELHTNYAVLAVRGAISDPGPSNALSHGVSGITDLRCVFSVFWDNPTFYSLASYAVALLILTVWIRETLRRPLSHERAWLLIASASALSMLPNYHRIYDARLLMLAVPAVAMLRARGGSMARWALLIGGTAVAATVDAPWLAYVLLSSGIRDKATGLLRESLIIIAAFPIPLSLLAAAIFFLWLSLRSRGSGSQNETTRDAALAH